MENEIEELKYKPEDFGLPKSFDIDLLAGQVVKEY